jgi:hypothetical protein
MKVLAVITLVASVVLFTFAASQQNATIDVPVLPTDRDQFGGRPGTFHFVTNEQTMANGAEDRKALAAVEAIDKRLNALSVAERDRLAPELTTIRNYVLAVDARRKTPAGKTAEEIEQRLNASKGKFMCGACHGHGMGMMHGGGMGRMDGNPPN